MGDRGLIQQIVELGCGNTDVTVILRICGYFDPDGILQKIPISIVDSEQN